MRKLPSILTLAAGLALAAFFSLPSLAADSGSVASDQGATIADAYTLGAGDRLRITVFGENDLSGEFEVDGSGKVSMPLIGNVSAVGQTAPALARAIEGQLASGYLRDPKVSIDVLNYRPFFILGEVMKPGSYPYQSGLTVVNAVALAGGYTYRADHQDITIERATDPSNGAQKAAETAIVLPGDVVRVQERFF